MLFTVKSEILSIKQHIKCVKNEIIYYVSNSYLVLWEFSTSQKEFLLVSSRNISSLISGSNTVIHRFKFVHWVYCE